MRLKTGPEGSELEKAETPVNGTFGEVLGVQILSAQTKVEKKVKAS